jgi:hypothetical protein
MFCAGGCLALCFPESAGGGLGLWVVQDRPARPSGRGRRGPRWSLASACRARAFSAAAIWAWDAAGGLAWSGAASSRTWACRPGPWRARSSSARADPAACRARVAGTGAFRRRMITRRGRIARGPDRALHCHGYPHVHSPARPHMYRGPASVFTQIIHRPIHRALLLAGQRAAGEHESREKAVIPRYTFPPGGREMTVTRIAC